MSRKSKRFCFSSGANDKPTIFLKQGGGGGGSGIRVGGNKKKVIGIWIYRLPRDSKFSPVGFIFRMGAKMARAIQFVSMRRRSSHKVSSSNLVRSYSMSDHTDSHRAEAVEDCIEFLHSSSSRQR